MDLLLARFLQRNVAPQKPVDSSGKNEAKKAIKMD
jgi:hypothetical protein